MLYRIETGLKEDLADPAAAGIIAEIKALGAKPPTRVRTARIYWIEGEFDLPAAKNLARELFSDPLVEKASVNTPLYEDFDARLIEVARKPGVMDPVSASIRKAVADRGFKAGHIGTGRKFLFFYDKKNSADDDELRWVARRILANDCIEEIHIEKPAPLHKPGRPREFKRVTVELAGYDEGQLSELSRRGCLSLTGIEMRAIQKHFEELGRDPTDVELETIAQTWSEHCRHKTLRGSVDFSTPQGTKHYESLLKETIVHATESIGHRDCLSVFKDNAGVIAFDDKWALTFKVETHNHPSAIEPYGGAGTGIGGVIRDTMGTGLGAKPIANTDVFCFGMPGTRPDELPPGALHPRRVMAGVVAGVRDYGNRMGIPTVNGAVHFDQRYTGNPLVYAGSIGLIPRDKIAKKSRPGDLIVVLGGRTGRDGIHGATFSSVELSVNSEMESSGAVQIGNAIEEKKVLDVLLRARDAELFTCVTDCGAGGLSSAVGEMAEDLGAVVELEKVPLKYDGLSYTEIWISEAQERMVLAVPPECWPALEKMCRDEDVEGTVIGVFGTDKILRLKYQGNIVGELSMKFLHGGLPRVTRKASWLPPRMAGESGTFDMILAMQEATGLDLKTLGRARANPAVMYGPILRKILKTPTVASKQWIVRQYDHEVQGLTVLKPLVGAHCDGPGDAAVMTPVLGSSRGFAVACGLCPQFTDRDPREMARLAVDECIRNLVAVGTHPEHIYILDNFSWGNTNKPEQLGSLVLACEGATEAAIAFGTPFISGKDSLNNEYAMGETTIAIPGTLLISGLGIVEDVRKCVTMDFKKAGNLVFAAGLTHNALGASQLYLLTEKTTNIGTLPSVDLVVAKKLYRAMHDAIQLGAVRACHDLSEGGMAVAAAEMAIAGRLGAKLEIQKVPVPQKLPPEAVLFSESPSRFLIEVSREMRQDFERIFAGLPHACIGEVTAEPILQFAGPEKQLWIDENVEALRSAWQGGF